MRRQEIVEYIVKMVKRYAYNVRVFEEFVVLDFDTRMMKFHFYTDLGKASFGLEILRYITDCSYDAVYELAVEEALTDIRKVDGNIVELLNLAGFSGEEYYKMHITREVAYDMKEV